MSKAEAYREAARKFVEMLPPQLGALITVVPGSGDFYSMEKDGGAHIDATIFVPHEAVPPTPKHPHPTIAIHCANCGSTDVSRDGTVLWDDDAQKWMDVGAVFDNGTCDDCGEETLMEVDQPFTCVQHRNGASPDDACRTHRHCVTGGES